MIIYGVYESSGEYEDYEKKLLKCFTTLEKAEEYVDFLEAEEQRNRANSNICKNCSGSNRTCPRWLESYDDIDTCYNWFDCWHDNRYYKIEDVELIED